MVKKLSINFIYNAIYQIAALIIPILTTPYVSRVLGAEGIGDYSFSFSIAYYFMLCIKLGLNNYGNRSIASIRDNKTKLSQTFWSIYALQLISTIVFTTLYLAYTFIFSSSLQLALILVLYVISAGVDITWFYWGMEEFKITVARDFIIKILTTLLIFLLVKHHGDVWKYTLILSCGALLSQIFLWYGLNKYIIAVVPEKKSIILHLKPNFMLFIPVIAVSLYNIMDKIMLGYMTSNVEVGYYESSEKITKIPVALVTSLGVVMLPRMSNIYENNDDNEETGKLLEKSLIFAMFLVSSLGFGIMTVAKQFVPLFYGEGFEKCTTLFNLLLPSCIFMSFANVLRTQYLIPKKKDTVYILSVFIGAGTNLFFNYFLIPRLLSVGAAIGTFAAEASVCFVQCYFVAHYINLKKYAIKTIPFLSSGILMFLVFRNIEFYKSDAIFGLLLKVITAGFFYVLVLAITLLTIDSYIPGMYNLKSIIHFKRKVG